MDEATNPPFVKLYTVDGYVNIDAIAPMRTMQTKDAWVKALREMIALTPPTIESLDEVIDPVKHFREVLHTSPHHYRSTYPDLNTTVGWDNFPSPEKWEAFFNECSHMFFPVKSIWDITDAAIEKDYADLRTNPPKDPIEATVRRLQYQGHLLNALKRK